MSTALRLLHISAGLPPKRDGGLPAYVLDLIHGQRAMGHNVFYLDMACRRGFLKSRLIEVESEKRYEFLNSGAYSIDFTKTAQPLRQVRAQPRVKAIFRDFLNKTKPDVIHIHELIGLPVELIPYIKSLGYRVVFTAQDYFSLCPTIKLLEPNGKLCTAADANLQCKRCNYGAAFSEERMLNRIASLANRIPVIGRWLSNKLAKAITKGSRLLYAMLATDRTFIERRELFRKTLRHVDRILCMSKTQLAEMTRVLGPEAKNLSLQYLSRTTYGKVSVKKVNRPTQKIVVSALNVYSVEKGRMVLAEAANHLIDLKDFLEIRMFGGSGEDTEIVKWKGEFSSGELDLIADQTDFAVIPSIWNESFGYVGPEMLTRGVPLIVSDRGAMREYVQHETNGLVVTAGSSSELATAIRQIVINAELRDKLYAGALLPQRCIKSFSDHLAELDNVYRGI